MSKITTVGFKVLTVKTTDRCMHYVTWLCSHAARRSAAILPHDAARPSLPREAAVSDRAAGAVTRVRSLAPATVTVTPNESSAAAEGRRLTASELESLFRRNKDCRKHSNRHCVSRTQPT